LVGRGRGGEAGSLAGAGLSGKGRGGKIGPLTGAGLSGRGRGGETGPLVDLEKIVLFFFALISLRQSYLDLDNFIFLYGIVVAVYIKYMQSYLELYTDMFYYDWIVKYCMRTEILLYIYMDMQTAYRKIVYGQRYYYISIWTCRMERIERPAD